MKTFVSTAFGYDDGPIHFVARDLRDIPFYLQDRFRLKPHDPIQFENRHQIIMDLQLEGYAYGKKRGCAQNGYSLAPCWI